VFRADDKLCRSSEADIDIAEIDHDGSELNSHCLTNAAANVQLARRIEARSKRP